MNRKTSDENRIVVELTTVRFLLVGSSGQHFCLKCMPFVIFKRKIYAQSVWFIIISIIYQLKRKVNECYV